MRSATFVLLLLASGCAPTLQEVRDEPVRFTVKVGAPIDKVGACIVAGFVDDFETVYLPVPSERRSEIILYNAGGFGTRITMAYFELKGDRETTVLYQRRKVAFASAMEQRAREQVAKCGPQIGE